MKDDKKQSKRLEQTSKWRKFAKKRWIYPAAFIAFAALVISSVLWMQRDSGDYSIEHPNDKSGKDSITYDQNDKAVPAGKSSEVFEFPAKNKDAVDVKTPFYDSDASAKKQKAALVLHNHTYRPNTGIDIASENGDSFTVTASMSGKVVRAEDDPTLGQVVKIDNGDGVTTQYQSLKDSAVEKGDSVKQGQELGKAGKNKYNTDAGAHLHFELRQDGKPVNPVSYFKQEKSTLQKDQKKEDTDKDEKQTDSNKKQDDMKKQQKEQGDEHSNT